MANFVGLESLSYNHKNSNDSVVDLLIGKIVYFDETRNQILYYSPYEIRIVRIPIIQW